MQRLREKVGVLAILEREGRTRYGLIPCSLEAAD